MSEHMDKMTDRDILMKILTKVEESIRTVEGLLQKIILSLIAIAGATVGLKFIGSPLLTVVGLYIGWFALIFVGIGTFIWRKQVTLERFLVRLVFTVFIGVSVITRTFIFHSGEEPAPFWFAPTIDTLFGITAILLVVSMWRASNDRKDS